MCLSLLWSRTACHPALVPLRQANAREAIDRLEGRLREAADQGGKLVADLDHLRIERTEAQLRVRQLPLVGLLGATEY